jgi:hypothetical protein
MPIEELEGALNISDVVDRTNRLIRQINVAFDGELDDSEFTGANIKLLYEAEPKAYTDPKDDVLSTVAPQQVLTQAAYDLLSPPNAGTMYIIIG